MALLDHNGESEFPFRKDTVFDAICEAVPKVSGMSINSSDKLTNRIMVKAGVSLWSWGEDIPIQLSSLTETKTKVQITSSPKTGIMFGGAFDMGKNRRNIEKILIETSNILSKLPPEKQIEVSEKNNSISVADELEKLKKLRDENIISEEEFQKLRDKVINS